MRWGYEIAIMVSTGFTLVSFFTPSLEMGDGFLIQHMSKIEERVIDLIRQRARVGAFKYGTTMERDDLTAIEWIRHNQAENLDSAIYSEKIIEVLTKLIADYNQLLIDSINLRNESKKLISELTQLATESIEREKELARLKAEVEALRSLSRSQEGDGTEKTKA